MGRTHKAPAFQFYAAEWLADENVTMMTLEEEGAYIRALAFCWREGSIPADRKRLSALLKGAPESVLAAIEPRFTFGSTNNERLVHLRLDAERAKQAEWKQKSSEAGKKSAKLRQEKKMQVEPTLKNGSTLVQPKVNSSSSSSSSKVIPPLPPSVDPSVYAAWREMRCKIPRAPFTPQAESGIIADLAKLQEYGIDPNARLRKALASSWRGVLFDNDKPSAPADPLARMRFANGRPQ